MATNVLVDPATKRMAVKMAYYRLLSEVLNGKDYE